MKSNAIKEKSFSFALEIVAIYKYLSFEKREFVLSKQILRSGTSIGANVREAEHAESKADFIHKLSIALKGGQRNRILVRFIVPIRIFDGFSISEY